MTTVGPGPGRRWTTTAAPRQPPLLSLLSSVDITPNVPDPAAHDPEGLRWLNGIEYRREPYGPGAAAVTGYNPTTHAEITEAFVPTTDTDWVLCDPFLVYAEEKKSSLGFTAADYIGRARRQLAVTEAYQVEKEFWTGATKAAAIVAGADLANDQWLAQTNTATILNGGTSLPFARAVSELQQAMADASGGAVGMIHGQAGIQQAFETLAIASPIPAPGTSGRGTPVTRLVDGHGNTVVPGYGYANTSPAGAAAAAGKFWLYGTGQVRIRRDDVAIVPDTYAQALDRAVNDIDFRAQRNYLIDWDRSTHFAVLADPTMISGY